MAEQQSESRVPFLTVIWPDENRGDAEPLRRICHDAQDCAAQLEDLGTEPASGESGFRDFSCDDFAEALLDYQMQIVWDEIEAAEAANVETPDY